MGAFLNWLWTVLGSIGFEQALAARQAALLSTLAMALEKQIPPAPFLEALAEDARGRWKHKVYGLADLLDSGIPLPEALEAQRGLVPAEAVMMVRAGAATGALTVAL